MWRGRRGGGGRSKFRSSSAVNHSCSLSFKPATSLCIIMFLFLDIGHGYILKHLMYVGFWCF